MEMDNNFQREQAQIKDLQHNVDRWKSISRIMEYSREEIQRVIERYPEKHAKRMEKVRKEREERVNAAIVYAAEITRRVGCMDRMEEKQKEQIEKIQEAGEVIFAENAALEQKIASLKKELRKTSSRKRAHADN
ncbi:unnamed protein product [Caenorhabditis nigoni]